METSQCQWDYNFPKMESWEISYFQRIIAETLRDIGGSHFTLYFVLFVLPQFG